jgi:gliding motility-associated-like protein/uncharacterized repeat protein (TIGR01451 family)
MYRAILNRLLLIFGITLFQFSLSAQTVTLTPATPEDFFVCGNGDFEFTLTNGDTPLENIVLAIQFSTPSGTVCGMTFQNATGATPIEPIDSLMPMLEIGDLAADEIALFIVTVNAPCSVFDCLNNGELFQNNFTLTHSGGTIVIPPSPIYTVETANLVITNITPQFTELSQGDAITRTITIRNTRFGPLSEFTFCDAHQGGFCVNSTLGNVIQEDSNNFCIELTAADFMTIGDGDGLFEKDEIIVIEEELEIKSCGIQQSSLSTISVGWGCDGDVCQEDEKIVGVSFLPTMLTPDLVFEPSASFPECFCGSEPFLQSMTVTNIGAGAAVNLNLTLNQVVPKGGMDLISFYVDSAGISVDVPVVPAFFEPSITDAPCNIDPEVWRRAIASFPELASGASITFFWETYMCDQDCLGEGIEWDYGYQYQSICGEETFVLDTIPAIEFGDVLSTILSVEGGGPLTDGVTHTFNYIIDYADLDDDDGTLTIELEIPCGLTWEDSNNPMLGGQNPAISIETLDEAEAVTLEYNLPMPADSLSTTFELSFNCADFCTDDLLCKDSIETSCMGVDSCTVEAEISIFIPITTSVNQCESFPNECAPQSCYEAVFTQDCPIDSFCIETVPGYVNYQFTAQRSNFGLRDDNDDQICDGTGLPDLNLINDHRLLPGDTIHAEVSGEIVVDVPGSTFERGILEIFFTGGLTTGENSDFYKSDGVVPLTANVRVFDSSSNTYYDCEAPLMDISENPLVYQYDYSPATLADVGCGIPVDFVFENGDSILFETDFRISKNVVREDDSTPLSIRLSLSSSVLLFNDPIANTNDVFRCGCANEVFEITGYEYMTFPGVFSVPPCAESEFIGGSLFQLILEEGNFFPYECRRIGLLTDFKLNLPNGFEIIESKLTFLRNQEGADVITEQMLMPQINGNQVCFDVADFQNDGLDEGFLALFQYRFLADCDFAGSEDLGTVATIDFLDQLPETADPFDYEVVSAALRSLNPNLIVSTLLCDITAFNNQAVLDFDLVNFQTIVASQDSGTAENVWIYPVSNAGEITNCNIFNLETGQFLPQTNGIFQLDSLVALDTFSLRLICDNVSCDLEEVELNFGWSCTPFTNPINMPCNTETKNITFTTPPGELELAVDGPATCSDLCDTIPYHIIEVFNAGLGTAYNVEITAQVPTGVTYLTGSTQVEYPCDSGNFLPAANPIELPNGDLIWSTCSLLPTLEDCGLPPVIFQENCFRMHFLSQSFCDLIINSQFIFSVSGEQNCGDPTNTLSDIGGNLCINDIEPPFSGTINVNSGNVICEDVNTHLITLQLNGETQIGDCLIIETPNGLTANCVNFISPVFPCNVTTDDGNYVIGLPPNVPAGNLIVLNLETLGYQNLECGDYNMTIQAATQTIANCVAIQDTCSTKVVVAFAIASIPVDRPIFELSDFLVTATPSGGNDAVDFTINVINTGASAPPITTIEFYLNTDLVHAQNVNSTIQIDEIIPLSGSFEIPENSLCDLIALVNPVCTCESDTIQVGSPITYLTGQNDTICSNEILTLGVEQMPGFVYQWTSSNDPDCLDFLACPTCPTTTFSFENLEKEPKICQFILLESDNMGCLIQNEISVTVQPTPEICLGDSPICIGEMANLCASDGVSFIWSPIISNEQCIAVLPTQTMTYSVTIVDAQGCVGMDEFTVEVVPLPSANLPATYLFCDEDTPQLDAGFNGNYNYNWSPGNPVLDNPSIANPTIVLPMDGIFSVTITDSNSCQTIAQTDVTFGNTPALTISSDISICLTTSATITVSGADAYVWDAPVVPADCQNNDCSEILVTPTTTTTYTVTGESSDGCTAQVAVTVTVVDGEITISEDAEICDGQGIFIFGELENEAGTYCETYPLSAGCDSTHCITVLLNPNDSTTIDTTICEGTTLTFNGEEYSESTTIDLETTQGCDSMIFLNIDFYTSPVLSLNANQEIAIGDTVFISNTDEFIEYEWTSSTGNTLEDCDGSPDCNDLPTENTTYILTVTDANGCTATDSISVAVIINCNPADAEIPNAFTPNGDGTNDTFAPVFEETGQEQVISMRIWNRWGALVFEGGQDAVWDGMLEDKPAAADVYIYVIKLDCRFGEEEATLQGDVTLIR